MRTNQEIQPNQFSAATKMAVHTLEWVSLKPFLPECLVGSLNAAPGESHPSMKTTEVRNTSNFIYERFYLTLLFRPLLNYIIRKLPFPPEPVSVRHNTSLISLKAERKKVICH